MNFFRGIYFVGLALLVLAGAAASAQSESYDLGDFQIHVTEGAVTAQSSGKEIASFLLTQIRLEKGANKAVERYGTFQMSQTTQLTCRWDKTLSSSYDQGALTVLGQVRGPAGCPARLSLKLTSPANSQLNFHLTSGLAEQEGYRLSMAFSSPDAEDFLGLGTQYTHLRLKGHKVPILSQEQGHGRGLQPISFLQSIFAPGLQGTAYSTYAPSSFFISTLGRSFFFPHYEYGTLDFKRRGQITAQYWSPEIRGEIFHADHPGELISQHTERVGRQSLPPDWIHRGAVIGIMGGTETALEIQSELKDRGASVAGWWLQDWSGVRRATLALRLNWNWQLDEDHYPGWQEMVQSFHGLGEGVIGYINPYISPSDRVVPPIRNLFDEAKERGFLVLSPKGALYEVEMGGFKAYLVDLFNPEARSWLKSLMAYMVDHVGLSGWMADFGEAFPFDGVVQTDLPRGELHHRYVEEWAKLQHEFITERGLEEELFVFSRSGFHGSQKYSSMYWLGDQSTTWDELDGMKTALKGLLSSGLSGWQFNHSDVGGYFSVRVPALVRISRSEELLYRWLEMNTFTPLLRTHEGLNPDLNFQFYSTPDSYDVFARFSDIFAELFNYRKQVFQEALSTGLPAVRHMYLEHPEDPNSLSIEDQFFLGSDLLVAPVLGEGVTERRVYLPAGSWKHLWSGRSWHLKEGLWIQQPAPLGEPPVYYRASNEVLSDWAGRIFARSLLTE